MGTLTDIPEPLLKGAVWGRKVKTPTWGVVRNTAGQVLSIANGSGPAPDEGWETLVNVNLPPRYARPWTLNFPQVRRNDGRLWGLNDNVVGSGYLRMWATGLAGSLECRLRYGVAGACDDEILFSYPGLGGRFSVHGSYVRLDVRHAHQQATWEPTWEFPPKWFPELGAFLTPGDVPLAAMHGYARPPYQMHRVTLLQLLTYAMSVPNRASAVVVVGSGQPPNDNNPNHQVLWDDDNVAQVGLWQQTNSGTSDVLAGPSFLPMAVPPGATRMRVKNTLAGYTQSFVITFLLTP